MPFYQTPKKNTTIEINCSGSEGNVISIIGSAINVAKQIGYTPSEINDFINKCLATGNYEKILYLIDETFPNLFNFYNVPFKIKDEN